MIQFQGYFTNRQVEIMKKENQALKVIFRKYKNEYTGQYNIIAFFPESYNYGSLMSYEHIGQHSESTIDFYHYTKPAALNEYLELYNELTNIVGYSLRVVKRMSY